MLIGAAASFAARRPRRRTSTPVDHVFGSWRRPAPCRKEGACARSKCAALPSKSRELDSLGLTPKEMPIAKAHPATSGYATIATSKATPGMHGRKFAIRPCARCVPGCRRQEMRPIIPRKSGKQGRGREIPTARQPTSRPASRQAAKVIIGGNRLLLHSSVRSCATVIPMIQLLRHLTRPSSPCSPMHTTNV